ncbi:hypothetical protein ACH5RR_012444 [Cinchona calisaya]|uniref:Uncharacterized protein n=1 Tax=Cinchona calisaya TaxID=153742 RepID=A0ABD3A8A9_9GENT
MAGQCCKPNVDQPSSHQRDLRDIELDELRRQVQQLQQRLERGKAPEHEVYDHVSEHDLSEDGEDVNLFHRTSISSADSPPRHYRKDRDFGCKIEIPDFEGKHDVDEFIDWLNTIERFFELKDVPDNQKMKKGLKKKFLLENYRQYVFLKFHSFKQNNLSVVDYTAEFEDLMLRCDTYEPEEQTIARYLSGLRIEIFNVVQLQPYWTFHDVCKLALKVEKQLKDSKIGGFRFNQQGGTTNRIGFGHIASDGPNRKIVSLMEEDIWEEAKEEPIYDEGHEKDIIYEDHGEALSMRRDLKQVRHNLKVVERALRSYRPHLGIFLDIASYGSSIVLLFVDRGAVTNMQDVEFHLTSKIKDIAVKMVAKHRYHTMRHPSSQPSTLHLSPRFLGKMNNAPWDPWNATHYPAIHNGGHENENANTINVNNSEMHSWHLHGHDFWVLAYGTSKINILTDLKKYNLVNLIMKNTVVVHHHGWTALKFHANNLGVWLFHCHVESHFFVGMRVVFEERMEKLSRLPTSIIGCCETKRFLKP